MEILNFPARVRNSVFQRIMSRRWKRYEQLKAGRLAGYGESPKGPIFILGCQRSGTTYAERLFRADPRSRVFGEFSELTILPTHSVWRDPSSMRQVLSAHRGEYQVIRSLLASHRVCDLLEDWPRSVVLWMFRDANSVVASMMHKWQGDFREVSEKVETDAAGHWELRGIWEQIEADVSSGATEALCHDRYAMYWYQRNRVAIDKSLGNNPRVLMVEYSDFVNRPNAWLKAVRDLGDIAAPNWTFPIHAMARSRSPSSSIRLSPWVQDKCDSLLAELRDAARRSSSIVRDQ